MFQPGTSLADITKEFFVILRRLLPARAGVDSAREQVKLDPVKCLKMLQNPQCWAHDLFALRLVIKNNYPQPNDVDFTNIRFCLLSSSLKIDIPLPIAVGLMNK